MSARDGMSREITKTHLSELVSSSSVLDDGATLELELDEVALEVGSLDEDEDDEVGSLEVDATDEEDEELDVEVTDADDDDDATDDDTTDEDATVELEAADADDDEEAFALAPTKMSFCAPSEKLHSGK